MLQIYWCYIWNGLCLHFALSAAHDFLVSARKTDVLPSAHPYHYSHHWNNEPAFSVLCYLKVLLNFWLPLGNLYGKQ